MADALLEVMPRVDAPQDGVEWRDRSVMAIPVVEPTWSVHTLGLSPIGLGIQLHRTFHGRCTAKMDRIHDDMCNMHMFAVENRKACT